MSTGKVEVLGLGNSLVDILSLPTTPISAPRKC